jgi:hypothetical protein
VTGVGLARLRRALEDHGCIVRGTAAQCPVPDHDDRQASLSISQGRDGAILKCHAGCATDTVLEALGMSAADLFDEPRGSDRQRPVTVEYRYTDEHGNLLFVKVRKLPKAFWIKRPDGRGGWIKGIGDARRVLYNLPAVLDAIASGQPVFLVEGEKDADAIGGAGAVATCNFDGAAKDGQRPKWRPEYGDVLKGATVIVVADKDPAGYAHAAAIRADLDGKAESVTVVEAAEGKDAADHLAAGYGLGDFRDQAAPRVLAVETKKEERTKSAGPPVPSADPVMFAGVLGEITAAAVPTTEADPVGIFASLLAGTGALIGPGPHVRVGNISHPLLIWPLLLGRTGSGRKGEATTTSEIFLRMAKVASFEGITVSGLSSGEGLIERIKDGETEDKRLLVIETEFTSVMARSRREGSTLAAVQRQAWDGRALSVLNRHQLKASASHVAIIGHITPREFRLRLAESDLAGGTYNRYLPLYVERTRLLPIPPGVEDEIKYKLGTRLSSAIDRAEGVTSIQIDSVARELWSDELYPELAGADDEDHAEAEFTRRAAPYCLRIAGLLAALEGRQLIRAGDLTPAAALVRYSIASARFVLDRQARDPRLDRIKRAVDGAGDSGLTRSAISGLFSRNLTKEVLGELLTQLTADGEYEETRLATRGRPAETYRRVVSS